MIPFLEATARRLRHHPTDADLVLYLDQELKAREIARIQRHLGNCWPCRQRLDEIQQGVHRFVANRKLALNALTEKDNEVTGRFLMRLAAEERFQAEAGSAYTLRSRLSWAFVVLLAMVLGLWTIQRTSSPPTVSASELLRETRIAEEAAIEASGAPLLSEANLRVARREGGVWHTALVSSEDASFQIGERAVMTSLRDALATAGLAGEPRLSARQFERWAGQLGAALSVQPLEMEEGSFWRITAESTGQEGPPRMDLLIRGADKKVCEHRISFGRGSREVLYVLSLDRSPRRSRVETAIDPQLSRAPETASRPEAPVLVDPRPADLARTLAALTVEAHHVLHREGLCLSGMVTIVREQGGILIQGVVERAADRERLEQQFLGQPLIRVDLKVLSEYTAPPMPAEAHILLPEAVPGEDPDFRRQVYEHLAQALAPESTPEEAFRIVSRFGNRALGSSQQVLQHAWAFRRLRQDFLPSRIGMLPEEYRLLLEEIASDHIHGVEDGLQSLSIQLRPLLAAAGSQQPHAEMPLSITDLPARIDRLNRVLFAGLNNEGRSLAEILDDLAVSLPSGLENIAVHRVSFIGLLQAPSAAPSNSLSMERPKP